MVSSSTVHKRAQEARVGPGLEALAPCQGVVLVEFADPQGKLLSNLASTPFLLDGVQLGSVEGFIQGIKFPPGHPDRERVFLLSGYDAKGAGNVIQHQISRHLDDLKPQFVYWLDRSIAFGSDEHHALIARAIAAKFVQNPAALHALVESGSALLIHPVADAPHTSLPAETFVGVLTELRSELAKEPAAA